MSAPITPLGMQDGRYLVRDANGQARSLSSQEIGRRGVLRSLFYDGGEWLRAAFPLEKPIQIRTPTGKLIWTHRVVDFDLSKARDWIVNECVRLGRVAQVGGV